MLYTPSHAELAQHPKTRKLARLLGVSVPTALGYLHLLWHFALKYAPDGDLSAFEAADIAEGILWEGDPHALSAALFDAGYLDVAAEDEPWRIAIHDWDDYGGKYVERRAANAERMRQARAQRRAGTQQPRAAHVERTTAERVEPEERREEERRGEDTPPLTPPVGGEPAAPAVRVFPPGDRSRARDKPSTAVKDKPLPAGEDKPLARPPRPVPRPTGHSAALVALFDQFWAAWPHRIDREEALSAFVALRPTDEDVGAMVAAIPRQSAARDWPKEHYRYCPNPANWLRGRRWNDELPAERPTGAHDRPYVSTDLDASMAFMRSRRGPPVPPIDERRGS